MADREYWLNDGNVILIARGVAFKLYKDLLAAQSHIFADLFSLPVPSTSETLNGCPVVRLMDSPEDIRHLLGVLLPKSHPT